MRILHVSDLHGNEEWYNHIRQISFQYDHIILSGDLVDILSRHYSTTITEQIEFVTSYLEQWDGPPLHITTGNHDRWAYLPAPSGMHIFSEIGNPRIAPFTLNYVLQRKTFAPNVYINSATQDGDLVIIGQEWLGGDTQPPSIKQLPEHSALIYIHHSPIRGLPTATYYRYHVDEEMFTNPHVIDTVSITTKPVYVLSGHLHQSDSWFGQHKNIVNLNPGFAYKCDLPNYIELDLLTNKATYHSHGTTCTQHFTFDA